MKPNPVFPQFSDCVRLENIWKPGRRETKCYLSYSDNWLFHEEISSSPHPHPFSQVKKFQTLSLNEGSPKKCNSSLKAVGLALLPAAKRDFFFFFFPFFGSSMGLFGPHGLADCLLCLQTENRHQVILYLLHHPSELMTSDVPPGQPDSAPSYSFHCFTLVFCRCSCQLHSFLVGASVV